MVVVWTPETAAILFYLIAGWVLVLGVLGIIASVVLYRARDAGWYWVLTFGLVNFLFGLLLLTHPQESVTVVVVLLGLFAFVGGRRADRQRVRVEAGRSRSWAPAQRRSDLGQFGPSAAIHAAGISA